MKILIVVMIGILSPAILKAQNDTIGESKFKCTIGLVSGNRELRGELYKLNDTSVTLKRPMYSDRVLTKLNFVLMPIPVSRIEYMSFHKKGSAGKGLLIGGLIGAFLGGLLGLASGDDKPTPGTWDIINFSAEEKACAGAIVGFIPGALIGLVAGSSGISFGIHGKKEMYQQRKKELDGYSIKN